MPGTGYIPDEYSAADRMAAKHEGSPILGASAGRARRRSFREFVPALEQAAEDSCAGFAWAAAICTGLRAAGLENAEPPSPMFIWSASRDADGRNPESFPLRRQGTYLRTGASVLRHLGFPGESAWPYEPHAREWHDGQEIRRSEARPPWRVRRLAFDRRFESYYRATTLDELLAALNQTPPVIPVVGLLVDPEYLENDGPRTIETLTPTRDLGHAQIVSGYEIAASGALYLELANWWGRRWRDDGFVMLRGNAFESARIDVWLPKVRPS